MGIFRIVSWPFRKVGRGFKWLFRHYSEEIVATIEEFAAAIVLDLMPSKEPGHAKFNEALRRLKSRVLSEGLEVYNHVLRRMIEKRVTQAHGDDLEEVLDSGLQVAIDVVKAVDLTGLTGDDDRRAEAVRRLVREFKAQGKEWLNVPHIIHVLIEYAVSSVRDKEE